MSTIQIGARDNGTTLNLKFGDELRVELAENPTTGFRWTVSHVDQQLLLVESRFESGPNPSPGAGGTAVFFFRALHPGSGVLSFKLWRSWSGDASITHRYQITLQVTPP